MSGIITKGINLITQALTGTQAREKHFQDENSMTAMDMGSKYPAMMDPNYNQAMCVGMYPGTTFANDKQDQFNYINAINQMYNNPPQQINPPQQMQRQVPQNQIYRTTGTGLLAPRIVEGFDNIPDQVPDYQHQGAYVTDANYPPQVDDNTGYYNGIQSQDTSGILEFDNFVPGNISSDPTSMSMLNLEARPISDFTHNNMVPYGTKFTQNMAGTGVRSGSDIDGSTFDSGADNSTPYQTQLASYTGVDDTYQFKREVGPIFSPAEQQTNYVYGRPVTREDTDYYTQSLITRNDMAPTEKIQVGRGLDLDPSIPASGGFHDFTRVLDNNVSDYKANQLEGRVVQGALVTGGRLPASYPGVGTSYDNGTIDTIGVVKNRPETYYSQSRYPTMTNKVGFIANESYVPPQYEVDLRPKNATRDQTSFGYGSVLPGKPTNNTRLSEGSYQAIYEN